MFTFAFATTLLFVFCRFTAGIMFTVERTQKHTQKMGEMSILGRAIPLITVQTVEMGKTKWFA